MFYSDHVKTIYQHRLHQSLRRLRRATKRNVNAIRCRVTAIKSIWNNSRMSKQTERKK